MDFNPGFVFEAAGAGEGSHPWTFERGLSNAHALDPRQTTVDEKIRAKLKAKDAKVAKTWTGKQDTDNEADSDEDIALPGELDDSEDELETSDDDDDAAEEADEVEEEEGEEHEGSDSAGEDDDEGVETAELGRLLQEIRSTRQGSNGSEDDGYGHDAASTDDSREELADDDTDVPAQANVEEGEEENDSDGGEDDKRDQDDDSITAGAPVAEPGEGTTTEEFFARAPKNTKFAAGAFTDLGLSRPLLKAVSALGYTSPTPIQAAVVPLALAGRDIVASAITGSGKTAAFALPLLERLLFRRRSVAATHVLVLCPTRELATQVHSMICQLAKHTDIRAVLAMGGVSSSQQAAALRQAPEIVVATPGRIIDHVMNTMAFELDTLSALVLDEADRLLEMGFKDQLHQILKLAPKKRQTLLFSATMTSGVKRLIDLSLTRPVRLAADASAAAPATLHQEVLRLKGGAAAADKAPVLCALCARSLRDLRTIIFCRHKRHAHWLKILMGLAGLPTASELHGDMTQAARLQALEAFRKGETNFLLATDVAARGLDILGVQAVVNYDCPRSLETYLHRVGRTARAGAQGLAISFVEDGDRALVKMVVKHVCKQLGKREVPKHVVQSWRGKVEGLAAQADDILKEEKEEKALRIAEMEAAKASNIIEHEAEIYSRPKREWFQSEKQRQATAKAAAEHEMQPREVNDRVDARQAKKHHNPKNGAARGAAPVHSHVKDTKHVMGSVKAAKSAARQFKESGSKPREAAKAALTATGAAKREKQKKRKLPSPAKSEDDTMPKIPKRTHVYAGGGQSAKVKAPKTGASKVQKARIARGGKGKGQFKSKQKYKRK